MWVVLKVVQLVVIHCIVFRLKVLNIDERLQGIVLYCALNTLILVLGYSVETTLAIEMNKLIAVGAYSVVLAHHMICWIVVVVVVDAAAPLLLCITIIKYRHKRLTYHVLRLLYAGKIKECWGIIDILNKLGAYATRLGMSRITNDEWCA